MIPPERRRSVKALEREKRSGTRAMRR